MKKIPGYLGIKKGYPRITERLGARVSAYVVLARPFTLVAPFLAGLALTLASIPALSPSYLLTAFLVGLVLSLLQATGQIINQYADVEIDRIVKPYRPLPRGLVKPEEALGLACFLGLLAIALAFSISNSFGFYSLLLAFFAIFYSLPPFSPRRINPFLNLFWLSISRGVLPVLASFAVYSSIERALFYSILSFLIVFGWQGSKDVNDAEVDRDFGIKTIANTYGIRVLKLLAAFSSIAYALSGVIFGKFLLLSILPLFIFGVWKYEKTSKITENVVGWTVFYVSLGSYFLLIFFVEIM